MTSIRSVHRQRYVPLALDPIPGARKAQDDAYLRDYERLDQVSRQRSLTMPESLRLEECIRRLDRRDHWRASKRKSRSS